MFTTTGFIDALYNRIDREYGDITFSQQGSTLPEHAYA